MIVLCYLLIGIAVVWVFKRACAFEHLDAQSAGLIVCMLLFLWPAFVLGGAVWLVCEILGKWVTRS